MKMVNPENFRYRSKEAVRSTKNIKTASQVYGKKRYCSEMISCVEANSIYLNVVFPLLIKMAIVLRVNHCAADFVPLWITFF